MFSKINMMTIHVPQRSAIQRDGTWYIAQRSHSDGLSWQPGGRNISVRNVVIRNRNDRQKKHHLCNDSQISLNYTSRQHDGFWCRRPTTPETHLKTFFSKTRTVYIGSIVSKKTLPFYHTKLFFVGRENVSKFTHLSSF